MAGETTWSYLSRLADRYGMEPGALLSWWSLASSRPRDDFGPRDDAEVLLNPAGLQLLARLGVAGEQDLARCCPRSATGRSQHHPARRHGPGGAAGSDRAAGRWKVASAG